MKPSRALGDLKDQFLSNVSHEFRSPLASVIGYLDLMAREAETLPVKHRGYLNTIRESSRRLKAFVDNLLDLTQLEAGLIQFKPEPIDVKGALEAITESHYREIDAAHLDVRVECAEDLCAMADPESFQKAIAQLLTNAIHFTPDRGKITVWAKDNGHQSILAGVSDTGIGIPRPMFERVFDKFEQVAETKNSVRPGHGTGLGLTVARALLEAQGGRIWIQQSSPKGTTLSCLVPKPQRSRDVRVSRRRAGRLAK